MKLESQRRLDMEKQYLVFDVQGTLVGVDVLDVAEIVEGSRYVGNAAMGSMVRGGGICFQGFGVVRDLAPMPLLDLSHALGHEGELDVGGSEPLVWVSLRGEGAGSRIGVLATSAVDLIDAKAVELEGLGVLFEGVVDAEVSRGGKGKTELLVILSARALRDFVRGAAIDCANPVDRHRVGC